MSRKKSRSAQPKQPQTPKAGGVIIRQLPLRAGGAFMALGVFLFIATVFAVFNQGIGAPYEVAAPFLLLCIAALCVGASLRVQTGDHVNPEDPAVVRETARQSRNRLILLVAAIVCVILTRFVSAAPLTVLSQWWLVMYGLLAISCGVVLRRAAVQSVPARR